MKLEKNVWNIVKNRFKALKPVQNKAFEKNFWNKNCLISSPTASGKTFLAEVCFINKILNENKKVLYVAPLRSLVREKFNSFKENYSKLFKISHLVKNIESTNDLRVGGSDLIILTSEKLDSLTRHNTPWLSQVGLVIVDEIHLIGDIGRGATLEIVLTKLIDQIPKIQVLGLSATVKNDNELADWLNAELIKDTHRPVELVEGVVLGDEIDYLKEKQKYTLKKDLLNSLITHFINEEKQIIIFTNSRRLTVSISKKLSKINELNELSNQVLNVLGTPTIQCEELSNVLKKGVCFHHAGLVEKQKELIENAFREKLLKVIVCTPTLAMGVDLPADVVVVNNIKRYSFEDGFSKFIKVGEYKQIIGRAGRPSYSDKGYSILISNSEQNKEELINKYILGEVEELYSSLGHEPSLRTIILSLISNRLVKSETSLLNFLKKTFFYFQYNNLESLSHKIREILDELESFEFIKIDGEELSSTIIGIRVSELYLDPLSANKLVTGIFNSKGSILEEKALIHLCCLTNELKPLLNLSNSDRIDLEEDYNHDSQFFLIPEPNAYSYESWDYYKAYKTCLMFFDWINEVNDRELMKKYKIAPGDLRNKNFNIDWILYSLKELALLCNSKELITPINNLRIRISNGIKKELIPLIKFKGIGRIRARRLYDNGLRTVKHIKNDEIKLIKILGTKLAKKVLEQI